MIAAGYEDGNDASSLRSDLMLRWRWTCRHPTASLYRRHLPSGEPADARALLRMGRAMVDLYCEFQAGPKRITLDIETRSMRFMAASSCGCSMRITMNTAFSRSSCSMARVALSPPCFAPPSGRRQGIRAFLRRLLRAIAPTGQTPRSCCAAIAIIAVPKFLTGAGPTASITSWASRDHDIAPAYRGPRGQHQGAL